MKILTILYIFTLFVLFSPNIFIKISKSYSHLIHSVCFTLIFYLTFQFIQSSHTEGAMFDAYDVQGNKYEIEATNIDLGKVELDKGMSSLNQQSRIIYTEPSIQKENILIDVPPLFTQNKLRHDIEKIMEHNHEENDRLNNIYCAANYGENTSCCNQPSADIPPENQCPKHAPICSGYKAFEQWGKCVSNDDSVPNIQYKEKKKELCLNKHESCPAWKRCCPGGPGSDKETKCGTDDCLLNGKPCVGSWMKENCPRTCDLCDDSNQWDGHIGGKYVAEEQVKRGNNNENNYATIRQTENGNIFIWSNDNGVNYILQRISNTNNFRVIGSEYNDWTMAKVHLDYNDHVKYIIGPKNMIFVKKS